MHSPTGVPILTRPMCYINKLLREKNNIFSGVHVCTCVVDCCLALPKPFSTKSIKLCETKIGDVLSLLQNTSKGKQKFQTGFILRLTQSSVKNTL